MPLINGAVQPSGRMGALWTAGAVCDSAVLEFGSMGHMLYAEKWMDRSGIWPRARLVTIHLDEKDISLGLTYRLEEALEELAGDLSVQKNRFVTGNLLHIIKQRRDSYGIRQALCPKVRCGCQIAEFIIICRLPGERMKVLWIVQRLIMN